MNAKTALQGHATALLTILVWGTTFVSTKVLLEDFKPVEILFCRFIIGMLALLLAYPHPLRGTTRKQELCFMGAGLSGVTLYYLLENIALTLTTASNVGVITSAAPFFTAMLAWGVYREEKPGAGFYVGFGAAMAGIAILSFQGGATLSLNPAGDILALLASSVWAVYAVLSKKIGEFGHNTVQVTRRVFAYGLLFMLPALLPLDARAGFARFADPVNLFNILFLGLGASALCFVTWNLAVKSIGPIKTSAYIYLMPVITVVFSVILLGEPVTWLSVLGMALTLAGLLLSARRRGE